LGAPAAQQAKLRKYGIVAKSKLVQLRETMSNCCHRSLLIRTATWPAARIISLHIRSSTASCAASRQDGGVRTELGHHATVGCYLLATLAQDRHELQDTKFALRAVKDHTTLLARRVGLRLRSWWIQRTECLRLEGAGGQEVGLAPADVHSGL